MTTISFPWGIDLKVFITDGKQSGVMTIDYRGGFLPTREELQARVDEVIAQDMPEGFRPMTKREMWSYMCNERFGTDKIAMPGGDEFDPLPPPPGEKE